MRQTSKNNSFLLSMSRHWRWNLMLSLTLLILDVILFLFNRKCGFIGVIFTAVYLALELILFLVMRKRLHRDLISYASNFGLIQNDILNGFEIPTALLDADGRVLWLNQQMCLLTDRKNTFRKNISVLFPEINRGNLPVSGMERDLRITTEESSLRAHIQRIAADDLVHGSEELVEREDGSILYILYIFDETEMNRVLAENREMRPVVGLVYMDNYEEVMERTDEVHQSLLSVLVERKISKYFAASGGLIKKLEKDKYMVIMNQKGLNELIADYFSILEAVKIINIGNDMRMTASIGIGLGGMNYQENFNYARGAIEMALGRGGDQAVVKNNEEMTFYGGKTQQSEKNTRVKARTKAQAMRELILSTENVLTMGHSQTDMDSFGAAVGVYKAARTVGKPAHIVLGEINTNIRGWVNAFRESKDFDPGMFISHEEAIAMTDENTAVIIVDTNRSSRVECPEILQQTDTIALLDHHRQSADTLQSASLSYIEPSASSACEMIAEILQYFEESVRLSSLEADCLFSGIVMDTNNFMSKTGVRTFEAAAYLRRCGADVTRVRKALRDNVDIYKARADAVSNAETFMDCYALSICRADGIEDPNVAGAQAANELLNIIGVKASFVVTPYDGKAYISARSIDEANVQLVMERLGGGGHLNMAGAQLENVSAEEAIERIKQVLREMTDEGAI